MQPKIIRKQNNKNHVSAKKQWKSCIRIPKKPINHTC